MAHHCLDGIKGNPGVIHFSGKGVPEHMGSESFGNSGDMILNSKKKHCVIPVIFNLIKEKL